MKKKDAEALTTCPYFSCDGSGECEFGEFDAIYVQPCLCKLEALSEATYPEDDYLYE